MLLSRSQAWTCIWRLPHSLAKHMAMLTGAPIGNRWVLKHSKAEVAVCACSPLTALPRGLASVRYRVSMSYICTESAGASMRDGGYLTYGSCVPD